MSESLQRLTAALAGRYEIPRALGAGGMATVYLARDPRGGRQRAEAFAAYTVAGPPQLGYVIS